MKLIAGETLPIPSLDATSKVFSVGYGILANPEQFDEFIADFGNKKPATLDLIGYTVYTQGL